MKKLAALIIGIIISIQCVFSNENLIKINSFSNGVDTPFYNPFRQVADDGDASGVGIEFDDNGKCYLLNSETDELYLFDAGFKNVSFIRNLDFCEKGAEGIARITEDYFLTIGMMGRCKKYDRNANPIFRVNFFDVNIRFDPKNTYYDEVSDVIFYEMYDKSITCIVHPGLDMEENMRNFHDAKETLQMVDDGYFAPHIKVNERKYLVIDGKVTPWNTYWYGNYRYQIVDYYFVNIWNGKSTEIRYEKKDNEIVESTAVHPSGDIYRLIYNKNTSFHILYRIENTWDPEWRAQWYAEHEGK